jgi:hypothetical protein
MQRFRCTQHSLSARLPPNLLAGILYPPIITTQTPAEKASSLSGTGFALKKMKQGSSGSELDSL